MRGRPALAVLAVGWALAGPGCSCSTRLSPEQEAALAPYVLASPPSDMIARDVDFDGKVRLVGFQITPKQGTYPPGTAVTLALVWRADGEVEKGFLPVTRLVAQAGAELANLDESGPLRRMAGVSFPPLPPARWQPGKFYRDELTFTIPADPSPVVSVVAAFADGARRLPIRGAGGDPENRALVTRLATGAADPRTVIKELAAPKLPPGLAITLDGRLDEPAWARAASTGAFVDVGTGREAPTAPTRGAVRLCWDDAFLYAGFDVLDAKVHGGWPGDAEEPHLWEKDTVEMMIDPDGDGDNKDYYEIQINPQNLVFDTQYDGYNSPNGNGKGPFGHETWSSGVVSVVAIHGSLDDDTDEDRGYTVEAKIPWASFTKAKRSPPAPGDAWRMNFYAMKNNGGVAWSPILGMGNFHRASRFGRVRWVDGSAPPAPGSAAPAASGAPAAGSAATPPATPAPPAAPGAPAAP